MLNSGDIPIWADLSSNVQDTALQVLILVGVFIILWLLRHLIAALLVRPLRYVARATETEFDEIFVRITEGMVSYLVLGLTVLTATVVLDLSRQTENFLTTLAFTLFAFSAFRLAYDLGIEVLETPTRFHAVTGLDLRLELFPVARASYKALAILVLLVIVANLWSFNVTSLVAGIGLLGLAVSLAAKELLDDVLGFAIIIGDNPFALEEYIVSPYAEGIVERIGVRSTAVRQLNQGLVTVPNSKIANDWVTNWSRLEQRWFNFVLGVTYTSTADQIEALVHHIREMLKGRESIQDDSIVVLFTDYEDSALGILVRCYVDIEDWTEAKAERHAVNLEIMRIINELDMTIAFPSRSIYLEEVPVGLVGRDDGLSPQEAARTDTARIAEDGHRAYSTARHSVAISGSAFSEGDSDVDVNQHGDPRGAEGDQLEGPQEE